MEDYNNPKLGNSTNLEASNLRKVIAAYLRRWPIFLLSILFFLLIAWTYTRYLTPIYASHIKVLIKDARKTTGADILLSEVAMPTNVYGGIDNEIEIMKSMRLMEKVVAELNISNTYLREGKVIDTEAYGNELPILLKSFTPDSISLPLKLDVKYNFPNITVKHGENETSTAINKTFKINNQTLAFIKNPRGNNKKEDNFIILKGNKTSKAKQLQNAISIELINDYSTVININIKGKHPKKSEEVLTELVNIYNIDAKKDKSAEFDKTSEFIEKRIAILDEELGGVESAKQTFKQTNNIADLGTQIGISLGEKSSLETRLLEAETQLSLVNTYKDHIDKQPISEILPNDISNSGDATTSTVATYNELVAKRNRMLSNGATKNHPMVSNLENQITDIKSSLSLNVSKQINALNQIKNSLSSKLNQSIGLKKSVPKLERITRDINRQQNIKESLYLLLLQKREEAEISRAITSDKIKIIDPASSYGPVEPVKSRYYFAAIGIGLLLPFIVTFIQELLKNKIETRLDLEELVERTPIVAELPKVPLENEFSLVTSDLSVMSEAFRIMRTNIDFVISKKWKDDDSKVILVTSSIKGEGKTFVSMNFTHILSQLKDKKVIIVGADIRNPQLHRYERASKNKIGLTEYLYDDGVKTNEIINISEADNKTNIIFSGKIPPNPTELLMSYRFSDLITELRKTYDYIIIDSAPLVLVSDTYHISKQADMTVYVTRSEFTPKDVLRVPMEAIKTERLNNVVFALNDISASHSGYAYGYKYNYGYGYGYGTKNRKRSLINRIFPKM